MPRIEIDESLKGKPLFKFLVDNKGQLIAQKKSMLKKTGGITCAPAFFNIKGNQAIKTDIGNIAPDAVSVRVKVVANAALWCDTSMDVLLPDCWKKTIKDRKGNIPHLHDHIHEIGAEVGDVADIYSQDISLSDLGLSQKGTTQVLIFETDVKKSYNPVVFEKYRAGKIKQHSIGLMYIKIALAINDEENEKEYDFWNKYYDQVINKDIIDEKGYFWVVSEIKLLENSAVLFGANELTPTLNVKSDTLFQPLKGTEDEPLIKDTTLRICPNCDKDFNAGTGSAQCPGCGQFVAEPPMSITFDLNKAIKEFKLFN